MNLKSGILGLGVVAIAILPVGATERLLGKCCTAVLDGCPTGHDVSQDIGVTPCPEVATSTCVTPQQAISGMDSMPFELNVAMTEQIQQLQGQLKAASESNEQAQEQLTSLQAEKDAMAKQLAELKQERDQIATQLDASKKQVQAAQDDLKAAQIALTDMEARRASDVADLNKKLQQAEAESAKLKSDLDAANQPKPEPSSPEDQTPARTDKEPALKEETPAEGDASPQPQPE